MDITGRQDSWSYQQNNEYKKPSMYSNKCLQHYIDLFQCLNTKQTDQCQLVLHILRKCDNMII